MALTAESCVACRADSPAVIEEEMNQLLPQVPEWRLIEEEGIRKMDRAFRTRNFVQALALTNAVGELAEDEGHHPRLVTEWGRLRVTWWTHKIRNLHRNDLIMCAKTNVIYQELLNGGKIELPSPPKQT